MGETETNGTMSSFEVYDYDLCPDVDEVLSQIGSLLQRKKYIFRGESKIYPRPCSSKLYRKLVEDSTPKKRLPRLLKQTQNELLEDLSQYPECGRNNRERLAHYQHYTYGRGLDGRGANNLLDFTYDRRIALFFACFDDDDEDGQIIFKPKSSFRELKIDEDVFPDNENVLFEPTSSKNRRAKDQRGVFLHAPEGYLPVQEETFRIKSRWKYGILKQLDDKDGITHPALFNDPGGVATRRQPEYIMKMSKVARADLGFKKITKYRSKPYTASANTRPSGFLKPKDTQTIRKMAFYERLRSSPNIEPYNRLLAKDTSELITSFTEALRRNPRDAQASYNRAVVYQSKNNPDYKRAISDYTRALKWNPRLAEAYYNRGNAHISKPKPDYNQAISDYSRAIELNPLYAAAYNNRGNAYKSILKPNYAQAISDYNRALKLNPRLAEAYNNRGNAYAALPKPNYKKAIVDYNLALRLNPSLAIAHNNRGNIYANKPKPNYKRAIRSYNRALRLNPSLAIAYNNRGNVYRERPESDYDRAISDYTYALKWNPCLAEAYHNRSTAYIKKTEPNYSRALSDHAHAMELNPDLLWANYERMRIPRKSFVWAYRCLSKPQSLFNWYVKVYLRIYARLRKKKS